MLVEESLASSRVYPPPLGDAPAPTSVLRCRHAGKSEGEMTSNDKRLESPSNNSCIQPPNLVMQTSLQSRGSM